MNLWNKIKKEKRQDKETLERLKKEEEELEREVNELMPESKFSFKESFELLKNKDEEEAEYESYLTEEELEEENRKKREEVKIIKIAESVMISVIILTIISVNVFYNTFKSDLLKITEPMLKEHYENITGEKAKTKTIEEFTVKGENNEMIKTGIYLLTTEDNKHIMSLNNELIGDDINISQKKEHVKDHINPYLGEVELVIDTIDLSYDDYYTTYNRYLEYINVLPAKLSMEELLNSNKLTLTYKAIYKGEIDTNSILNIMTTFSPNSCMLLFKQESSGITNATIIKNNKAITLNITAEIEKTDGISYLELDRNINNVSDVKVSKYANSSVSTEEDYTVVNPISIKKESERNREEEEKTSYYLIRVSSSLINDTGFLELSTYKKEDTYREIKREEYEDVLLLTIGSHTYIFGENNLFIGQKGGKKSFLCKLGIC